MAQFLKIGSHYYSADSIESVEDRGDGVAVVRADGVPHELTGAEAKVLLAWAGRNCFGQYLPDAKCEGKVVVGSKGTVAVQPLDGEAQYFVVPASAKVTIDGEPATVADVCAGSAAIVTTDKDGRVATVDVKTPKPVPSVAPAKGAATAK